MKGSAITGPVGKEAAELWPVSFSTLSAYSIRGAISADTPHSVLPATPVSSCKAFFAWGLLYRFSRGENKGGVHLVARVHTIRLLHGSEMQNENMNTTNSRSYCQGVPPWFPAFQRHSVTENRYDENGIYLIHGPRCFAKPRRLDGNLPAHRLTVRMWSENT